MLGLTRCLGLLAALLPCAPASAADFTTLAAITGNTDAASGSTGLVAVGSSFYGASTTGGAFGRGALFSLDPSTGAESVVYSFTGHKDGAAPAVSLTNVKGILYGITNGGLQAAVSTIFKFDPVTVKLSTVYSFGTSTNNTSLTSLTLCNGVLYGVNPNFWSAEIFSFDPATRVESVVYSFPHGPFLPKPPGSPLTALNGVLYGATQIGGANGTGDIYSFSPATGVFTELYAFTRTNGSLQMPAGPLTLLNGTLYGVATGGGPNSAGGVFGINPTTFAEQTVTTSIGYLLGGLAASDGKLYGAAYTNAVFSLDPVTGAVSTLYSFQGGLDGDTVDATLTPRNGVLYGTTSAGGQYGVGTIFAINQRTGAKATLHSFAGINVGLTGFNGGLTIAKSALYGASQKGGANDHGSIFRLDPATGGITTIYAFTGQNDGGAPAVPLDYAFGRLYGSTLQNGASGNGTLFSMPLTGKIVTAAAAPAGTATGRLTQFGAALYALYQTSGKDGVGSIVAIDPATLAEKIVYSFNNVPSDGSNPAGTLLPIGSKLWGVTQNGGASGQGTIFNLDPATGAETIAFSFSGNNGWVPSSGLIDVDGILYGTTVVGGNGGGTLFTFNPATSTEKVLYQFNSFMGDGNIPFGPLTYYKGVFYGTTVAGGAYNQGTIFAVNAKTGAEKILHTFTGYTDGGQPYGGLTLAGSRLFGMTNAGGLQNIGTIFSIAP